MDKSTHYIALEMGTFKLLSNGVVLVIAILAILFLLWRVIKSPSMSAKILSLILSVGLVFGIYYVATTMYHIDIEEKIVYDIVDSSSEGVSYDAVELVEGETISRAKQDVIKLYKLSKDEYTISGQSREVDVAQGKYEFILQSKQGNKTINYVTTEDVFHEFELGESVSIDHNNNLYRYRDKTPEEIKEIKDKLREKAEIERAKQEQMNQIAKEEEEEKAKEEEEKAKEEEDTEGSIFDKDNPFLKD